MRVRGLPLVIPLKFSTRSIAVSLAGGACRTLRPLGLAAADTKIPTIAEYHAVISPILEKHCYECHGDGYDKGKVAFDDAGYRRADPADPICGCACSTTRAPVSCPRKRSRGSRAAEQQKLERWIKYGVFRIDPRNPDPGRVTVRRLNRVEYRNTVRDLLGVDYNTDHEFPPDDTGFGFDNIGDALTMSPMLMEKYVAAAQTIVERSRADRAPQARRNRSSRAWRSRARTRKLKWGKRQLTFNEPANVGASFKTSLAGTLSREARPRSERRLHPGSGQGPHHLQGRRQGIPATRNSPITTRRPSCSSPAHKWQPVRAHG